MEQDNTNEMKGCPTQGEGGAVGTGHPLAESVALAVCPHCDEVAYDEASGYCEECGYEGFD